MGIGTSNPQAKLAVNGDVFAKKIKVTQAGWADFVFDPGYSLYALSDLEAFIRNNHHLPHVPTEKEVAEKGFDIGEMNKILLQKIEELTLYTIELNKKNQELEARLQKIEDNYNQHRP